MASKKDFDTMKTGRLFDAIQTSTAPRGHQDTASPEEQEERAEAMRTQGRKGCKAVRINVAFTPSNHQFVKVMARASGKSMNELVNLVVAAYQQEHPEILGQAQAFLTEINSGRFSALLNNSADQDEN